MFAVKANNNEMTNGFYVSICSVCDGDDFSGLDTGTWLRKLPTCRRHVAPTAKCHHIFPKCPCCGDTILIPTPFLYRDLLTSTKVSSIVPEVHTENSSVRFGRNICSISVRHGCSCSSPRQNLKSLQLPELFQHKAASIKQHLLPQHKLHNNIEPAHPYQSS